MDNIVEIEEIFEKIVSNIKLDNRVMYIPYGDGEQNYTIFYKDIYPYKLVNKNWYKIIKKENNKNPSQFSKL